MSQVPGKICLPSHHSCICKLIRSLCYHYISCMNTMSRFCCCVLVIGVVFWIVFDYYRKWTGKTECSRTPVAFSTTIQFKSGSSNLSSSWCMCCEICHLDSHKYDLSLNEKKSTRIWRCVSGFGPPWWTFHQVWLKRESSEAVKYCCLLFSNVCLSVILDLLCFALKGPESQTTAEVEVFQLEHASTETGVLQVSLSFIAVSECWTKVV